MPSKRPLTAVRSTPPSRQHPNLGPAQRLFSLAGGVALVLNGLRGGGPAGFAQVALGLATTWRGYTGVCKLSHHLDQTAYEHFLQHDAGWDSSKAVSRSVTINRPRSEIFAYFQQPANLARLMPWVEAAHVIDEHSSRWTATGPLDRTLSWTLKQNVIKQDQALQWDTAYQGPWKHRIEATFGDAPQGRGTEVKVVLAVEPYPGSAAYALASAIATFSDKALLNLLRRTKQHLETGEVATNQMHATPAQAVPGSVPTLDTTPSASQPREDS